MPGAHAGFRPPQPLVSTIVPQPAAAAVRTACTTRAHAAALVEVGARAEDERAPAGVADRDGPHGAGVALDGGLGEPGDLGVVDGRQRLAR